MIYKFNFEKLTLMTGFVVQGHKYGLFIQSASYVFLL